MTKIVKYDIINTMVTRRITWARLQRGKRADSLKRLVAILTNTTAKVSVLIYSCIDYIYSAVASALGGVARDSLATIL